MTSPRPTLLRVSAMLIGGVTSALVPCLALGQLSCGGTIGPGGTFTMTTDILNCTASGALTVVGPVVLDMNGHRISCNGGLQEGIRVEGSGAQVTTGTVSNCLIGVNVTGAGGHTIRNLFAQFTIIGFGVASDGNTLVSNGTTHAGGSSGDGFQINGNRNKITANSSINHPAGFTSSGNGNVFARNNVNRAGTGFASGATTAKNKYKDNVATHTNTAFDIAGSKQVLKGNTAIETANTGFHLANGGGGHVLQGSLSVGGPLQDGYGYGIEGDDNRIKNNRAQFHNVGFGVIATSQGNTLSGNEATGNQLDAFDANIDCDDNTWKKNLFGYAVTPSCVH